MRGPTPTQFESESEDVVVEFGEPAREISALSSPKALSRFEFEAGKGNEGTKVLMVEVEDVTAHSGDWKIEWSSKTTVLSAKDGAAGSLHRVYFLLAPGATIPPVVKLSKGGRTIHTNPLPAIFPPELGVSATTAGKRGVLHTIWGKQRLVVLQKEIETEMKTNGEGVGLEMALQEKKWIEDNFGVSARVVSNVKHVASSTSARSPVGGKLSDKLRGLRIGTSSSELNSATATSSAESLPATRYDKNPLSPDADDVVVSSFAAFHGVLSPPRMVVQSAPEEPAARQKGSRVSGPINSLDAVIEGSTINSEDTDLFAVQLTARSPEMTKSPFSFAATNADSSTHTM